MSLNHKSNSMDVTMVSGDNNEISAHKIILSSSNPKVCKFFNSGYCRLKSACTNIHYMQICSQNNCKNKLCKCRHPVDCRYGSKCRRKIECMYAHNRNELVMIKLANKEEEIIKLKDSIQLLIHQKDLEISNLKKEIKEEINQLNKNLEVKDSELNISNLDKNKIIKENIKLKNEVKVSNGERSKVIVLNCGLTDEIKNMNNIGELITNKLACLQRYRNAVNISLQCIIPYDTNNDYVKVLNEVRKLHRETEREYDEIKRNHLLN